MDSERKWTPEPWGIEQTTHDNWIGPLRPDGKVGEIVCRTFRDPDLKAECRARNDANADRIVACVNALSGVRDPAEFVAAARADLKTSEARIAEVERELQLSLATGKVHCNSWAKQVVRADKLQSENQRLKERLTEQDAFPENLKAACRKILGDHDLKADRDRLAAECERLRAELVSVHNLNWTGSICDRLNSIVREHLDCGPQCTDGASGADLACRIHAYVGSLRESNRKLREAVEDAAKTCECKGTGFREGECRFCGDSTFDHECVYPTLECWSPQCKAIRTALAAIRERAGQETEATT